jgi:STE24 endopeptidase
MDVGHNGYLHARTLCSVPGRLRLPAVLITAFVVAEVAVVLLRPRDIGPEPVPVAARAYFSEAQLAKAKHFRSGQRWLFLGSVVVQTGVLVLAVWRAPDIRRIRRPVLRGAAAGAALSLVLTVASLPLSAVSRERAKDVGLVTQSWTGWVGDIVKSEAIGITFAAAGGALLIFGMRRFGRRWWIPGAVVVVTFGVLTTFAGPVVLDPIFNKFTPLRPGPVRSAVIDLAHRAGIDVGGVYEVDASRRTTAANAYVNGIGHTKRVVLYDTLLKEFSFEEIRLVVAHELGHVRYRDVPHGLLYLAIVAPFGMLAAARLAEALGARESETRAVAATALSIALLSPAIVAVSNQLSRAVERRADYYAMTTTGRPDVQISFQKRIAIQNVSDPDPPRVWQILFGTHPTTLERIGVAEALRR